MRILIDADGCPVVGLAAEQAGKYGVECIIICDFSHEYNIENTKTVRLPEGTDSVDYALVNMAVRDDIVITQDYGLAAMCLSKQAIPVSQDGMVYSDSNIDALLLIRHESAKIRRAGGRTKGKSKRTKSQDDAFKNKLLELINKNMTGAVN